MDNTGTTTPFDEIDTLHGLLRVALDDARKVDRDVYLPVKLQWHYADTGKQCEVCLAGFVMVRHLRANPWESLLPAVYREQTQRRLLAIDALGRGEVETAWSHLHPAISPPYQELFEQAEAVAGAHFNSWEDWDAEMPVYERLHDALKEAGL